jgi:hypothetical protein
MDATEREEGEPAPEGINKFPILSKLIMLALPWDAVKPQFRMEKFHSLDCRRCKLRRETA